MRRYVASAVVSISLLANCAGDLPKRSFVKSDEAIKQREAEWDNKPAIQTVRLPGRFFMSEPLHGAVPAAIAKKQLDITMPGGAATLDDLLVILEAQGLSVSYSWESAPNADDIGAKRLPFRKFDGTVGELLSRLQMGMSMASWWYNNTLYLAPLQRYTVKVPQNDEVIGVVEGQLESLGGQDIVSSLYAGQVTYSASPEANEELIAPFLRRLALNMSEITLQVALVRVSMNEAARRGFDWSNFNLAVAKNVPYSGGTSSSSSSSSTTPSSTTPTTTTTTATSGFVPSTITVKPDGSQENIGIGELTGLGTPTGSLAAGTSTATEGTGATTEGSSGVEGLLSSVPGLVAEASVGKLSLTAAIGLLSEFGTTSTDQNVELRTLAGQPVHLRDGGETPYVSQVTSNNTTGGTVANTSSSVEFETVDTGLTLDMTPNFDAGSGIVTVDVSLNVEDIESFLSLPSGSSYGNIERPVTSNRELTDLVRVAAGETVILGGVTKIAKSDDRSAPLEFWTLGSDNTETDRQALFVILRPFVTVYELDGNEMGMEARQDAVAANARAAEAAAAAKAQAAPPADAPKTASKIVQQSLTKSGTPMTSKAPAQPAPAQPAPAQPMPLPPAASVSPGDESNDGAEASPASYEVNTRAGMQPLPNNTAVAQPAAVELPAPAPVPAAPPKPVAIVPSRAAPAPAPAQATPTSLTTGGSGSAGNFNDLVGSILTQPSQQQ
jgi:type II secretory pathway component GspD/PulD (secretin)